MSSRWGLRVDAERHHKSLEGICPWGVRYMVWIVIPEEGYPHLKAWPGGHLTPSSCYWCASTFPTSSTRLGDIRFPGFILVQLVLASVSVSDLKGTHLHRQSVYQLWWLNQWAKQTTPTTGRVNLTTVWDSSVRCSLSYIHWLWQVQVKRRVPGNQPSNQWSCYSVNICTHTHTHTHTELWPSIYLCACQVQTLRIVMTTLSQIDNSKLPEMPIDGATSTFLVVYNGA